MFLPTSLKLRNLITSSSLISASLSLHKKYSIKADDTTNHVRKDLCTNPLEIERKFWYDFDIEKRLCGVGAKKIESENDSRMRDEYFDNFGSYFMLLNDYLLRKRTNQANQAKWQLKYRSASKEDRDKRNIEQYYEIDDVVQIIDRIHEFASLKTSLGSSQRCGSIESLIESFQLKCFAKINSTRKSFIYENVRIDLDETDFGYKLGEIELISHHNNFDLDAELKKIDVLTEKLGILERKIIPGKISAYLYCFDRNLFEILKSNKALDKSVEENLKLFFEFSSFMFQNKK